MGFQRLVRRIALGGDDGWSRALWAALACSLGGAAVRTVLIPVLGSLGGSSLFVPSVVVAGLWAGRRGAYAAMVLSQAIAWIMAELHPDPINYQTFLLGVGIFVFVGVFCAEVAAALRRTLQAQAQAVDELERGQQNLRLAHEAGALGAWEWDLATDTLRLSDGYLRNWRILKDSQAPFLEVARRVHPDDYAGVLESRRRVLEDGDGYSSEYRVVGPDGQVRWYTSRGEPERDDQGRIVRVHGVNRDITEQMQAEQALRESEARFRLIADSAPVNLWMGDETGACVYLNRTQRIFWGLGEDYLETFKWTDTLHPDDAPGLFEIFGEAMDKQQAFEVEARYRRADGEWRVLHTQASPRFDAAGQFLGMIGVNVDVTDARLAETALRESEARFRTMANSAPSPVWVTRPEGGIEFVNEAFAEFFGLGPSDLMGEVWVSMLHPDDRERIVELSLRERATGEPYEFEAQFRNGDGEYRWVHARCRPRSAPDGAFMGYVGIAFDVTDARLAEAALRESEARFRAMADSAPSPIWVSGPNGGIDFINQATKDFVGGDPGEMLATAWLNRVHPDDRKRVVAARNAGHDRQEAFAFEARFRDHRGDWRWMRASTRPRLDATGGFDGYIGIAFDVTEARQAQDALRLQERRQRFLLQLGDGLRETEEPRDIAGFAERALGEYLHVARAGYGEIDHETGTITIVESWTDGTLEPISGVYTLETYGPALIAELLKGRTVRVADTARDPRTATVSDVFPTQGVRARLSVPVVRSGQTQAVFFLHDIEPRQWSDEDTVLVEEAATRTWTEIERARALAEVRESEERFRSIADSAPILVWVTNADRSRAFVNKTYVEFMGGDYQAALTGDWRTFLHPDDWDRILQEQIAGEGSLKPFSLEARYKRHDGTYRWLRSFSRPRFGRDRELVGFVGAAYDVTEERQVQADLEHINELLAERVSQALAEKEHAEAALIRAQRLEALGRLTGGVAHDFNNLLTVVVGALDMILKHPDDEAKRTRMAEAAMAAARRGEQLTHQLLAFSRRQPLRPALSDLNALIRENEPLIRRAAGDALEFETDLCDGEAVARVDPAQFEAALFNLVVNARDATGPGGRITITTERMSLAANQITDIPAGDHIVVRVSDTGEGMDPSVLARVFEPFFTTKPQGKGTGLGLSQVYGFAQQSGGGVSVESTPGQGTTLTLFLPASAEALPSAQAGRVSAPIGSLKVLLVEDDIAVAGVAETMLRHLGHEVTRVSSAARALAKLRSRAPFDLLLSDVIMPGAMNGAELAERALEMRPGLKIVLSSGYAGEALDNTISNQRWPFLPKPYSQEELAEILRSAWAGTEAPRPAARPRRKAAAKTVR